MTHNDKEPSPGRNYRESAVFTFGQKVFFWPKMRFVPKKHPKFVKRPSASNSPSALSARAGNTALQQCNTVKYISTNGPPTMLYSKVYFHKQTGPQTIQFKRNQQYIPLSHLRRLSGIIVILPMKLPILRKINHHYHYLLSFGSSGPSTKLVTGFH